MNASTRPLMNALLSAVALLMLSVPAVAEEPTRVQKRAESQATRMMARGEVQFRLREFPQARSAYKEALKLIEKAFGKNDLRLVRPLRGLSQVNLAQGSRLGTGRKYLLRVLELFEQGEHDEVSSHFRAFLDLGDWDVLAGDGEQAAEFYRRGWALLVERESIEAAAREFNVPQRLDFQPPVYQPTGIDDHNRIVTAEFTIAADGRTSAVQIVTADAPTALQRDVRRSFESARFRPRLVDGEPVNVAGVRVELEFPAEGGAPQQR